MGVPDVLPSAGPADRPPPSLFIATSIRCIVSWTCCSPTSAVHEKI